MKKRTCACRTRVALLVATVVVELATSTVARAAQSDAPVVINDFGKLYPATVLKVVQGKTTADLVAVINEAREQGLRVSIAGKRHSQGGHAFYEGAVVLDMNDYDDVLQLDIANKLITVQSGATWEEVQDYVNTRGLAVKVMQSSNIFTIGGSLSANVHGRDPNYGPLIETVRGFRLLTADGTILNVSKTENAELFTLTIGGYGLFGVILDADIELTDNLVYEKRTEELDYTAYPQWFAATVGDDPGIGLHYGRLSVARNAGFLKDMYVTSYRAVDAEPDAGGELSAERFVRSTRFLYGLSRRHDWAKALNWRLLKTVVDKPGETERVTRNNAMRPPVSFLEHASTRDTDILQEYFIPTENFATFTDKLRELVTAHDINLLNVTIRYLPAETESFLRYARADSFAFVLDINHGLSADERAAAEFWTQALVDTAAELGGTYYLTYQLYPSSQQIRMHYPDLDRFFAKKLQYDPGQMFVNTFYAHYAGEP